MDLIWDVEARTEFIESAAYYGLIDPDLGERFIDAVERALAIIQLNPERFRCIAADVRRAKIETFPYAVVFLHEADQLIVVAVMHLHREPGYWKQRIR